MRESQACRGNGPTGRAKAAGKYRGRKPALTAGQATELRERLAAGEGVSAVARDYGISRQTVDTYKRLGSGKGAAA